MCKLPGACDSVTSLSRLAFARQALDFAPESWRTANANANANANADANANTHWMD